MQSKADMTLKIVEIPEIDEAVPLGAAMLAGIGAGLYGNLQQAFEAVSKSSRVIEPDEKAHAKYLDIYQQYKKLYPALKNISH